MLLFIIINILTFQAFIFLYYFTIIAWKKLFIYNKSKYNFINLISSTFDPYMKQNGMKSTFYFFGTKNNGFIIMQLTHETW